MSIHKVLFYLRIFDQGDLLTTSPPKPMPRAKDHSESIQRLLNSPQIKNQPMPEAIPSSLDLPRTPFRKDSLPKSTSSTQEPKRSPLQLLPLPESISSTQEPKRSALLMPPLPESISYTQEPKRSPLELPPLPSQELKSLHQQPPMTYGPQTEEIMYSPAEECDTFSDFSSLFEENALLIRMILQFLVEYLLYF